MSHSAFLPIELERRRFLVEARLIREILGESEWIALPRAEARLPGILVWNGRALPLFDLAHALELSPGTSSPVRRRTVIASVEGELLGLPVDEAREVLHLDPRAFSPTHAAPVPFSSGELEHQGQLLTWLDLPSLVREVALPLSTP